MTGLRQFRIAFVAVTSDGSPKRHCLLRGHTGLLFRILFVCYFASKHYLVPAACAIDGYISTHHSLARNHLEVDHLFIYLFSIPIKTVNGKWTKSQ